MIKYAVVEIAGKQYQVAPGQELLVNSLGDVTEIKCQNVLLLVDDKGIQVGEPYLKDSLTFQVLEEVKGEKIRVAKYHPKANTRKVIGSRSRLSKIKLVS